MKHSILPGQDLVMIGEIGTYGADALLRQCMPDIQKRFGRAYLAEELYKREELRQQLRLWRDAAEEEKRPPGDAAAPPATSGSMTSPEYTAGQGDARAGRPETALSDCYPLEQLLPGYQKIYGVTKLRRVGRGGVLKALWDFCASEGIDAETGQRRGDGIGCEFRYDRIPIRQFTMELCELFDLFPYRLWSEDCWLLAADRGLQLIEDVQKEQERQARAAADAIFLQGNRAGFDADHSRTEVPLQAAVFGRFTKGKKRLRTDGAEIAYLTREDYEELERFLQGGKRL